MDHSVAHRMQTLDALAVALAAARAARDEWDAIERAAWDAGAMYRRHGRHQAAGEQAAREWVAARRLAAVERRIEALERARDRLLTPDEDGAWCAPEVRP